MKTPRLLLSLIVAAALVTGPGAGAADKAPPPAPAPEAAPAAAPSPGAPALAVRAYVLVDLLSGQTLASQKPDERVEPASLTKLMTAYLVFTAITQKKLDLTQTLPVSERAWKAEGSRMFIEPKKPVTVDELLHGMIIQSGNDASIALAEGVAGSEDAFAELMNKEAQRLGMKSTHYMNATGLPNAQHYATAADLALIASAIVREFPDFYKLYSQREYRYNNITQPNRNRLLWSDATVDGMKTGHTEAAGFCLVSSARRGDRRLVSVVLGAASDTGRTTESQKLLNYGFQYFETQRVFQQGVSIKSLPLYKGQVKEVKAGFDRDVWMSLPKGDLQRHKETLTTIQPLIAPLSKGQKVGSMQVTVDGKPVGEYSVVVLEDAPLAGFFGRTWDSLRLMLK